MYAPDFAECWLVPGGPLTTERFLELSDSQVNPTVTSFRILVVFALGPFATVHLGAHNGAVISVSADGTVMDSDVSERPTGVDTQGTGLAESEVSHTDADKFDMALTAPGTWRSPIRWATT